MRAQHQLSSRVRRGYKEWVWLKSGLYLGVHGHKMVFKDRTQSFLSKALMGRSQQARKLAKQKNLQKTLLLKSQRLESRGRRG